MNAKLIDGREISNDIKDSLKASIQTGFIRARRKPLLVVVLVGDDPASHSYIKIKQKACEYVGIETQMKHFSADCKQVELEDCITELNKDETVDGILMQLPLPADLDADYLLNMIDPSKDVDGLSPINQGLLCSGREGLFPCTPLGIMAMIKAINIPVQGKVAVIIGKSQLVGRPIARMLEDSGATVIVLHSRSENLEKFTILADILISAAGRAHMVLGHWIKPGAAVIDVGNSWVGDQVRGDVEPEGARLKAGFLTPVPGGVGPMTVAFLLVNTVKSWQKSLL
ncbi:MAG: bifunctional 5,10-methylene-tetrahydrofolate dehydrogenase/5,10-methylene-tetrahydrofolate cyclohydrolase [Zetaproteobacteria bacterium]|nr:bifunctional 5,10-methylene-tetrahydrofolate dehydrogenase/5,10-methylene-tetrahydrofolate cyclohydrolase [Pseudobdellovibrionaceae bacterium]|tara:strand:+ start:325 stop:1176 length:852 start_codon:yes stop_codon:yes gene_type:complete